MVYAICSKHEHIVVYIITIEQKNYINQNLKKIQKSDENLRAELTHFVNQTTPCLRLNKIYKPVIQL